MKIKNLLIITIIFANFYNKAFIVSLETLRNQITPAHCQYIIKAGDAHFAGQQDYDHPTLNNIELSKINFQQASNIIDFAENLNLKDCLFILEDMYQYAGTDLNIKNIVENDKIENQKNNYSTCMDCINSLCTKKNIAVINIEFRHANTLFMDSLEIKTQNFLNNFYSIINELKNYNDNKIINKYYSKLVKRTLKRNKSFIDYLKNNKNTYFNLIKDNLTNKQLEIFHNDMCNILDARIIHNILKHSDKKFIFICAGATHTKKIETVLKKINFQNIYNSSTIDIYNPIDLKEILKNLDHLKSILNLKLCIIFIIYLLTLLFIINKKRLKILSNKILILKKYILM